VIKHRKHGKQASTTEKIAFVDKLWQTEIWNLHYSRAKIQYSFALQSGDFSSLLKSKVHSSFWSAIPHLGYTWCHQGKLLT